MFLMDSLAKIFLHILLFQNILSILFYNDKSDMKKAIHTMHRDTAYVVSCLWSYRICRILRQFKWHQIRPLREDLPQKEILCCVLFLWDTNGESRGLNMAKQDIVFSVPNTTQNCLLSTLPESIS